MKKEKKYLYNLIRSLGSILGCGRARIHCDEQSLLSILLSLEFLFTGQASIFTPQTVTPKLSLLLLTSLLTFIYSFLSSTSWISLLAFTSNSTSSNILSPSPARSLLLVLFFCICTTSVSVLSQEPKTVVCFYYTNWVNTIAKPHNKPTGF